MRPPFIFPAADNSHRRSNPRMLESGFSSFQILASSFLVKDSAPPKLSIRYCLSQVSLERLETTETRRGVALATPHDPKTVLQSLPLTLRGVPIIPIPNYSKASGVFSSSCRKAASSPPLYFHRANPRDSHQVVIPFVRVWTSCVYFVHRRSTPNWRRYSQKRNPPLLME